ncbi:hypothetical protein G7Y89_g9372 [Cudoniella acicularis]|uniref:Uncharacterized protein n=1 Tax=Cudoniella acicularis TaxID=354080 RepID=A0A8H4RH39_9HELO|nr:hypothetical protein G7Y89_g9372 [Cudoniella acicularis]
MPESIFLPCHIQHIELQFLTPTLSYLLNMNVRNLSTVLGWSKKFGNLKSLSLRFAWVHEDLEKLVQMRYECFNRPYGFDLRWQHFLDLFKDMMTEYNSHGKGVAIRLHLDVLKKPGDEHFPSNLDLVAKDLHEVFGGEIWINGRLCYIDSVQLLYAFKPAGDGPDGRFQAS